MRGQGRSADPVNESAPSSILKSQSVGPMQNVPGTGNAGIGCWRLNSQRPRRETELSIGRCFRKCRPETSLVFDGSKRPSPAAAALKQAPAAVQLGFVVASPISDPARGGLQLLLAAAGDLFNLTLASPEVNGAKSNVDAFDWMAEKNQCWFAQRVVDVTLKHGMTVDKDEADALEGVLSECRSTALVKEACALLQNTTARLAEGKGTLLGGMSRSTSFDRCARAACNCPGASP